MNLDPATATLFSALGVGLSRAADFLMARRQAATAAKTAADANTLAGKQAEQGETDRAYQRLNTLVDRLEKQLGSVQSELDEERSLRRAAERRVGELELALHRLKLDLTDRGIVPPSDGVTAAA